MPLVVMALVCALAVFVSLSPSGSFFGAPPPPASTNPLPPPPSPRYGPPHGLLPPASEDRATSPGDPQSGPSRIEKDREESHDDFNRAIGGEEDPTEAPVPKISGAEAPGSAASVPVPRAAPRTDKPASVATQVKPASVPVPVPAPRKPTVATGSEQTPRAVTPKTGPPVLPVEKPRKPTNTAAPAVPNKPQPPAVLSPAAHPPAPAPEPARTDSRSLGTNEIFARWFEPSGRPKFNNTRSFERRFDKPGKPPHLNQARQGGDRWNAVYAELLRVADPSSPDRESLLFKDPEGRTISGEEASRLSSQFGRDRIAWPSGAHRLAMGWSVNHKVRGKDGILHEGPACAEFMSELIRQAYVRAGRKYPDLKIDYKDEFDRKGFPLDHAHTPSVETLAVFLDAAGWVPWDSAEFRPKKGAIIVHDGVHKGHIYMSAADDGTTIIDSGQPRGRNLRVRAEARTSGIPDLIDFQYKNSVFFLPPGINPNPW